MIGPGEGAKPREVYQKADGSEIGMGPDKSIGDEMSESLAEEGELPEEVQESLAGNVEEDVEKDNSVDNPENEK